MNWNGDGVEGKQAMGGGGGRGGMVWGRKTRILIENEGRGGERERRGERPTQRERRKERHTRRETRERERAWETARQTETQGDKHWGTTTKRMKHETVTSGQRDGQGIGGGGGERSAKRNRYWTVTRRYTLARQIRTSSVPYFRTTVCTRQKPKYEALLVSFHRETLRERGNNTLLHKSKDLSTRFKREGEKE